MNVPALSERTLQRDLEKGSFSTGSEIQVYSIILLLSVCEFKIIIQLIYISGGMCASNRKLQYIIFPYDNICTLLYDQYECIILYPLPPHTPNGHIHTYMQSDILRKAAESDPGVWWWIKGDGVDLVKGIGESMRGQWSGDVDLNDGKLNLLHQEYQKRLEDVSHIGLGDRRSSPIITMDLRAAADQLKEYLTFIHAG